MTRAPEFPAGLSGPMLAGPVQLHGMLDGTVRLVLFFRAGCVHSRHALADLAAITERFQGRAVATLAVHVPVHAAERDDDIALAGVAPHPVAPLLLQDPQHEGARAFGITALPTLVLVDATGEQRFRGSGEPHVHRTADAVGHLLTSVPDAVLPGTFLDALSAQAQHPAGLLAAPSALCVQDNVLWVADAARHRVLQVDIATGRVLRTVGSGHSGMSDGEPEGAAFRSPMGLCAVEAGLLVADTGNHALRLVEPATGNVMTVCGNGVRGSDRFGGGFGAGQSLSSPRGLLARNGGVVVAMAGCHQLWQFDPTTEAAMAWIGTGATGLVDGEQEAQLHEPLALCAGDGGIFVADAGNGAIRFVDDAHGRTRTVARGLARPAGVAWDGEALWIADPWQRGLLRMGADGVVARVGGVEHGLDRPCALAAHDGAVFVADTAALWCVTRDGAGHAFARMTLRG